MMATGKSPYARARADRQAGRDRRRRPGGARLRACARGRRPSRSTIFEPREKAGGLNEYGIAAYKTPDDFAAARGRVHPLDRRHRGEARRRRSAATSRSTTCGATTTRCFSASASARPTSSACRRETELENVIDAVDYIARAAAGEGSVRAAGRPARRGDRRRHDGDRRRGAVEAARRRDRDDRLSPRPGADEGERATSRNWRRRNGVLIRTWARPVALEGHGGAVSGVVFERTRERRRQAGRRRRGLPPRGRHGVHRDRPARRAGRARRRGDRRSRTAGSSSTPSAAPASSGVWAGGDCVVGGQDLTVGAVEDGKQAARSIAAALGAARA